ncbi:hypothetical protein D9M71_779320 [compost metagenome]
MVRAGFAIEGAHHGGAYGDLTGGDFGFAGGRHSGRLRWLCGFYTLRRRLGPLDRSRLAGSQGGVTDADFQKVQMPRVIQYFQDSSCFFMSERHAFWPLVVRIALTDMNIDT